MEILDMNLTEGKALLAGTLRKVKNGELTAEGIIAKLSRESLESEIQTGAIAPVWPAMWRIRPARETRKNRRRAQPRVFPGL